MDDHATSADGHADGEVADGVTYEGSFEQLSADAEPGAAGGEFADVCCGICGAKPAPWSVEPRPSPSAAIAVARHMQLCAPCHEQVEAGDTRRLRQRVSGLSADEAEILVESLIPPHV